MKISGKSFQILSRRSQRFSNTSRILKYLHFGSKSTSRVEGAHAYIKTFLQVSTADLLSVLNKLTLALVQQVRTEETRRSEEQLRFLNGLPSTFTPVCGMISAFAIKKCLEEFKRKTEKTGGCTMVFTSTMGIPCAHKLKKIENSGSTLTKMISMSNGTLIGDTTQW